MVGLDGRLAGMHDSFSAQWVGQQDFLPASKMILAESDVIHSKSGNRLKGLRVDLVHLV
jgi:hypothetical protein